MYRDNTKVVKIGNKLIGGGNPIMIQSMTNTRLMMLRQLSARYWL
mgnify:CR=1 FL=1